MSFSKVSAESKVNMSEELESRTGAKRRDEIPKPVLKALHLGQTETKNLVEWLAVDRFKLAQNLFADLGCQQALVPLKQAFEQQKKKPSPLQQSVLVGKVLAEHGVTPKSKQWPNLANHPSDLLREWCCTTIGAIPQMTLKQRLKAIKPFAADEHFGVRELAWLPMRPHFIDQLEQTFQELVPWTKHRNIGIRRFASEATRPCGVWTMHIKALKQTPEMALPVLEPLKADSSRYVQDSVGNWLNDASKSSPQWVIDLTDRWKKDSDTPETAYIIKRALRTLKKQGVL